MRIKITLLAVLLFGTVFVTLGQNVVKATGTIEDRFPKLSGNLRSSSVNVNFGPVKKNIIKKDTLRIYNAGKEKMTCKLQVKENPALLIKLQSSEIMPGKESYIAISYDAAKIDHYGFIIERFILETNDSIQPMKPFVITAKIEEYFPPMTAEDSANVQRARIPETRYDYGTVTTGTVVKKEFKIYNDGKRDLLVREVKSGSSAIVVNLSAKKIAPGDSAMINLEFNTAGREGKDNRSFSIFLNDPAKPETRFELMGTVKKD